MKKFIPFILLVLLLVPCNKDTQTIVKKHASKFRVVLNKKTIVPIGFKHYYVWDITESPYIFFVHDPIKEESFVVSFQDIDIYVRSTNPSHGEKIFTSMKPYGGWPACNENIRFNNPKFKNCMDSQCFKELAVVTSYASQVCTILVKK